LGIARQLKKMLNWIHLDKKGVVAEIDLILERGDYTFYLIELKWTDEPLAINAALLAALQTKQQYAQVILKTENLHSVLLSANGFRGEEGTVFCLELGALF